MGKKKPKQSLESLDALTAHSRWVVEYLSAANNNMLLRAATLLGLIGVEVAFVATWDPDKYKKFFLHEQILVIGVSSALLSAILLVVASAAKNFVYPNFSQIHEALDYKPRRASQEVLEIMLHKQSDPKPSKIGRFRNQYPKRDLFDRLLRENKHITWCFQKGTYLLLIAQVCFGLLLIMKWINH